MRRLLLLPAIALAALSFTACYAPAPSQPNFSDLVIAANFAPFGQGTVNCMLAIADRESSDNPAARNSSGASGLFQIMLPLHDDMFYAAGYSPSQWADPYANTRAAGQLVLSSGLAPWGGCP